MRIRRLLSIGLWCVGCGKVSKVITTAINPETHGHNICLDCNTHLESCNGCEK